MRKFICALFACMLVVAMSVTAFAATGLNANEKAVLDALKASDHIPQAYVNTAMNYFLGDCDMTEAEKNQILAYIAAGSAVIKNDAKEQGSENKDFSLSDLSAEGREEVLQLGKEACAEVDLTLSYAPSSNKVVITPVDSKVPVFVSSSVIKATGEDFSMNTGTVCAAVVLVMILGSAVMFGISKKNGLLV